MIFDLEGHFVMLVHLAIFHKYFSNIEAFKACRLLLDVMIPSLFFTILTLHKPTKTILTTP